MRSAGSARTGSDVYPSALGQAVLAFHHDFLTGCEAFGHGRDTVLNRGNLDGPPLDRVVSLDHIGVLSGRSVLNGLRGHGWHALARRQDHPHIDKSAGPQSLVSI